MKIPANGQETRQFAWTNYRMDSNRTKEGTFTVGMNFVDDNGFASVSESSANIRSLGNPVRLPE